MQLHIAHLPKLILQRRTSAILGMIIIALLWVAVAAIYREDTKQDLLDYERRNQNYAMLFEENVLRSIGEIDKSLLYLRRSVEAAKDYKDYQTIVMTTDVLSEIIVQMAIIDADGISRGSNATAQPSGVISVKDREHFRAHLDSNEDKLFISKPVIGRASGKWSVQFTRRFSNKDGSFAGVVVASMSPEHFASFYDKIDLGSATAVALIGSDGVVRSSGGAADRLSLGQSLKGTKLYSAIEAGKDTTFEDEGASPDDAQFITVHPVRGYPLWVAVATKTSAIYESSWSNLKQNVWIVSCLTLLTLIALEQILRAEERAQQKAEQLQLTLEHISQGIMLVTKDLQVPIINRRCGELLQLPKDMVEKPPPFLELARFGANNGNFSLALDGTDNKADAPTTEPNIQDYKRPDGTYIEVRKTRLPDGGVVQTFTDITVRREAEAHIARLASEDPLTKLANRRVFGSKIDELTRQRRMSGVPEERQADFAVLFLDMDRFKVVNDTLGHRIGDRLLIEVAQRLKSTLRRSDLLSRLGGDEFAILISSFENQEEIQKLAARLIDVMTQPFQVDRHLISTSVSIGIAIGPHDGRTDDDLLVAADLALYAVKVSGRGAYRFYERSMHDDVNDRHQIEIDLRHALENNELELFYQPIIDLKRNAIVAFEALARWRHPTKGVIAPSTFISVAEDCGLILPLGEWALAEACRVAKTWPAELSVSVNLSPVQIVSPHVAQTISRILLETNLEPHRLTLEITERVLLDETDKTISTLRRLKEIGVKLALDDFGTGYSSLSYLRNFPFDIVKIDRSFVADLGRDSSSNVIVQAVVLLADGLGIKTVAEGIETSAQLQLLQGLGCGAVQGYLPGRPVPVSDVPAVIEEWNDKRYIPA
ncbi:MAG: GGDEF-domain containing protein [Rhizobiales bacterium 62-17]|nr:EAL domain-containing protein [Hyphomicrobiales bacterium]OJY00097.1 MAG: GGDEF-domain containing protein [Rhizobiales bacterium 62-17]